MKVLIIGFSDLVKRKVFNAISSSKTVTNLEIASKNFNKNKNFNFSKVYDSYDEAIATSKSDLVYISLPNSMHFEYACKSLEYGKHVIVDKPSVLKMEDLNYLLKLAHSKNLSITESTVYEFHKAFKKFKQHKISNIGILNASFKIPMLTKDNFRNKVELGGGVINDMAVYATSIGKNFWDSEIENLKFDIKYKNLISNNFKVNIIFKNGGKLNGEFSFDSEYTNYIKYSTQEKSVTYNRVFSPPSDLFIDLQITEKGKEYFEEVGYDDTFLNFMNSTLNDISNNNFTKMNEKFKSLNLDSLKLIEEHL